MNFLFLLCMVAFSATAFAEQNLTEILLQFPACSAKCSAEVLTPAGCHFTDLRNCFCPNFQLRYDVAVCVLGSCNLTEQFIASTITQTELCNGVPQESRSDEMIRASIIIAVVTAFIVALRFVSRIMVTRKLWWDDWAILLAVAFMIPNSAVPIFVSYRGFGHHFFDVPAENIQLLLKLFYIVTIFYVMVQNIPKFSILLFYLRIFPSPKFRRLVFLAMTWQALHTITFLLTVIFQCVPVESNWDLSLPSKCLNLNVLSFVGESASILEDFVIMFLPVYELKNLKLDLRKRVGLCFMFAVGSFACVTSMVRMKYLVNYGKVIDATWENVDIIIWSEIETYSAVICACLMCLRPLLLKLFPKLFPSTHSNSRSHPSNHNSKHSNSWGNKFSSKIRGSKAGMQLSETDDSDPRMSNVIKVVIENSVCYEMELGKIQSSNASREGEHERSFRADDSKEDLNEVSRLDV
ncbi:hypothetical protein BGZ60DRAFT_562080 [Tricladium varicosporioides]|nr:hypothetical protein BGZ60DRAFT_562080 [Hymenoscyphus varicosporioides]